MVVVGRVACGVFATVGGAFLFATTTAFLATMSNIFCTVWAGAAVGAAGAGVAFCFTSATSIYLAPFAPPPASAGRPR